VVLCYGGLRVLNGDIEVGVLASFLLYLQRFFDPLQDRTRIRAQNRFGNDRLVMA
jgi:ABC-type multidrug transport system fused ATPase/permease subunit